MSPENLPLPDILLPEPVRIWPLPWLFWIGLLIALGTLALLWWFLHPYWRRYCRRRVFLRQWKHGRPAGTDPAKDLQWFNRLLKNLCAAAGHPEVLPLHGDAWANWLIDRFPERARGQACEEVRQFVDALYQPQPEIDQPTLDRWAQKWSRALMLNGSRSSGTHAEL